MNKQFSYVKPLSSSEREIKVYDFPRASLRNFSQHHYQESKWIKSWGKVGPFFSKVPLLSSGIGNTAFFLKSKKRKKKMSKTDKLRKNVNRLLNIVKECQTRVKWILLIERVKEFKSVELLVNLDEIVKEYVRLHNIII